MTDFSNWPREPHGIFVDHQDHVWVGSYNRHRVMKFTRDGKLLLTLGEYEKTAGSADTHLLGGPSGIWVDPQNNEAYISDGYRNRRVIVVDGAGIGSAMAANKVPGVRAAPCHDEAAARNAREHNDANVLTLGSKFVDATRSPTRTRCTPVPTASTTPAASLPGTKGKAGFIW